MAQSSLLHGGRPPLALAIALLLLAAPACAPESVLEARSFDCAGGDCAAPFAPSGDDPAAFCDDDDPCTLDADCTPCSTLPPEDRDLHHCTADDDLPPLCAGKTGCVHAPLTTPAGQSDDCFPVAGAADLHAGVCRVGRCVENEG